MTALFSERRRADELAAVIDDPQRDVDHELRALAGVVSSLRVAGAGHPDATPRADFARELRVRLMAEAGDVLAPGAPLLLTPRTGAGRERRLVAAASVVVVLGGSAGMAAASQGALPGDVLYPVKRGIERAEAGLSVSPAGKGRDLIHQAGSRLIEVRGLLADDRVDSTPRVPGALEDFIAQAEQGSDLLMSAFQETRDPAAIEDVRGFTADSIGMLQELSEQAPESARPGLAQAALVLRDIDARAAGLCSTCAAGLPTLRMPDLLLAATEADRALTRLDTGALDNSHPFLVPRSLSPSSGEAGGGTRGTQGATSGDVGTGDLTGGGTGPLSGTPTAPPMTAPPAAPTGAPTLPGGGTTGDGGLPAGTVGDVGEAVSDPVGQITDGLTGVVETVLPDPVTGPGLLP
jgi:Domain of unknown function (DUF5667)